MIMQFFAGDDGRMSMSRLLMFGSFIITSAVMLTLPHMNEGYFSMFLAAYNGTYLTGKFLDTKGAKPKE